jgi:hypothetical protein
MLTRERANRRRDTSRFAPKVTLAHRHTPLLTPRTLIKLNGPALPPIQLRDQCNPALLEPLLIPQRREEVRIGELLLYALRGRVTQVVVVAVADDDDVHYGQVFDFAGRRRVALQAFGLDGRAAVFEDGIEEDA